jgi:hypothetical protein
MECHELELNGENLNSLENLCLSRTFCIDCRMLELMLFLVISLIKEVLINFFP